MVGFGTCTGRHIAQRMRADRMRMKNVLQRMALGAAVAVFAAIVYRSIQYVSLDRAVMRHECWTWRWLPFHAGWIWPYLSMFVLAGLPWFMLPGLWQVRRFAICLLAMAAVSWILFLGYPTACARPSADGQPAGYALLLDLDQANNCLPCLHSAVSVLAAWTLAQGTAFFQNLAGKVFLIGWLLVIFVSIVALRQHTDGDMLAGVGLGCLSAWRLRLEPRMGADLR